MKRKADGTYIRNTSQPEPENSRPRADSIDSLVARIDLPSAEEDIKILPRDLELGLIQAKFDADMSELIKNKNKNLLSLFGSSLKEDDTETCKKIGAVLDNAKMLFRNDEKKQIKEVYPI